MESYTLPSAIVHLALFHLPPASSAALLQRLVEASKQAPTPEGDAMREAVNFAFIDASMLCSRLHLLTAVNHALLAAEEGMRTTSLPAEVLWYLEPSSNISDSLRHFGLRPSSTSLVIVQLSPTSVAPSSVGVSTEGVYQKMLGAIVEGQLGSLDQLGRLDLCDTKTLRKLYKLNQDPILAKVAKGSAEEARIVDELCCSSVPLKAAL